MSFWDATHGIAVSGTIDGHFVIFMTDGPTWKRVPDDRLPPAQPNEGFFAASGTNIAVLGTDDVWIGTGAAEKARVLRSSDHGRKWKCRIPLLSGSKSRIYSIAFRDNRNGVVVGGACDKEAEALDNCAVTSDGGATWTLIKSTACQAFDRWSYAGKPGALLAVSPSGRTCRR
jgi:photosystem II stability/assembly factor-like uncharacterized protein